MTVPGAVDGWFALHERWGRLTMGEVLEQPIRYANEGFPLSPVIAAGFAANQRRFQSVAPMIEEQANANATYFAGGVAPKAGDVFKIKISDQRSTRSQKKGVRLFSGSVAQKMAAYFEEIGADLTLEDLQDHTGEWVEPRGVEYHGYTLFELPPNGQGFAALMMLKILKNVDLRDFDRGIPRFSLHG